MLLDKDTAGHVMWRIIAILKGADRDEPSEVRNPPIWYRDHAPLLQQWFVIANGEERGTSHQLLQGLALLDKLDAAFDKTRPILDVLKASNGKKWEEALHEIFYPGVAELEYRAAVTGPQTPRPYAPVAVEFPLHPPKPVSLAEMLSVATGRSKTQQVALGHNFCWATSNPEPNSIWPASWVRASCCGRAARTRCSSRVMGRYLLNTLSASPRTSSSGPWVERARMRRARCCWHR